MKASSANATFVALDKQCVYDLRYTGGHKITDFSVQNLVAILVCHGNRTTPSSVILCIFEKIWGIFRILIFFLLKITPIFRRALLACASPTCIVSTCRAWLCHYMYSTHTHACTHARTDKQTLPRKVALFFTQYQ